VTAGLLGSRAEASALQELATAVIAGAAEHEFGDPILTAPISGYDFARYGRNGGHPFPLAAYQLVALRLRGQDVPLLVLRRVGGAGGASPAGAEGEPRSGEGERALPPGGRGREKRRGGDQPRAGVPGTASRVG
jgi:hypothetical protein